MAQVPEALGEYIAIAYAELRGEEQQDKNPTTYTTARTLLSILRLAQALARLRFSHAVAQPDVDEALRLMKMSKVRLRCTIRVAAPTGPSDRACRQLRRCPLRSRAGCPPDAQPFLYSIGMTTCVVS
jgi:DNA replicative helicase MCM subunit Mcm2 (Cdc46/Mcm family)